MPTIALPDRSRKLEQELETMFREHYAMLYRTAYGMVRNSADAEEIPQTIFLRLLRSGVPPKAKANIARYLYRAAVNQSLDVIRTRKRQRLTVASEFTDVAVDDGETQRAEELHRLLAEALTELRPQTVEILMLKYVHSYREAEIAKLLGVSRGTVAIKLFRSRAHLRKTLLKSLGD